MSDVRLNFPILKLDEEKREVWGYATTEALDKQNEIVEFEASRKAFDEWTSRMSKTTGGESLGNVRELHQPKAVGKLISYQPIKEKRGIWVGVKLSNSDDGRNALQKVKERVLTGFSIGGTKAKREPYIDLATNTVIQRVTEYTMAELSLVDNMANDDCAVKLVKGEIPSPVLEQAEMTAPSRVTLEVSSPKGRVIIECDPDDIRITKALEAAPVKDSKKPDTPLDPSGMEKYSKDDLKGTPMSEDTKKAVDPAVEMRPAPEPPKKDDAVKADDDMCPEHKKARKECADMHKANPEPQKSNEPDIRKMVGEELIKAQEMFKGLLSPLVDRLAKLEKMEERLAKIEAQPLPPKVKVFAVEKGANLPDETMASEEALLEKALAKINDPVARDHVSRVLAAAEIKRAQAKH
jgi:phage head maturation protease